MKEEFSEKILRDYLEEIFFKDKRSKICIPMHLENEVYTWKEKIKEGYLYQCGTSPYMMVTGFGGVIRYGKELEKNGFSNEQIEEDISITNDEGIFFSTEFIPIKHITWEKKNDT